MTSAVGVCLGLGMAGGLWAQPTLTTTFTGQLGAILSGNGAVTSGTYSSGITATGSAGQYCVISFTNGGGTGATAQVKLSGTNIITSGALLINFDYGTGYTTPPTTATVISGGTASCDGSSVSVTTKLNDPLSLSGQAFQAIVTGLNPVGVTYNANSITYNGVTVQLTAAGIPLTCTNASATITNNNAADGGNDTLALSNCNLSVAGINGTFSSTVAVAPGTLPAPIPLAFTTVPMVISPATASSGTYVLNTAGSPPASTTLALNGGVKAECANCTTETLSPAGPLTFTVQQGGSAPDQTVTVNTGGTVLAYAVTTTSTGNWLTVNGGTTTGGSTGGSFAVNVNSAGLAIGGPYTGTIKVYTLASNSPQTITVNLTVTAPTPTLSVSPSTSLSFTSADGAVPPTQNLTLSSSGTAISYSASASSTGNWLSVSPASGSTTAGSNTETVSINSSALALLATGTYNGSVTFTCTPANSCGNTNGQLTVSVSLRVTASLIPLPTSLTFDYTIGGTVPSGLPIGVTSSGGAITYTAAATTNGGGSWLVVSPGSATTNTGVTASLSSSVLTGLAATTYTGKITLTSSTASNSPVTVPVTLVVHPQPTLSLGTHALTFTAEFGGSNPASQNVSLTVANGPVSWTAAPTGSWLHVTPTSGTTSTNLSVSVDITGLAANTYHGTVTVTANGASGSPATIDVTLTVGTNPLSTSPSALNFTYQIGLTPPTAQNLTVHTVTEGTSFTAAPSSVGNWLSVTPGSGTTAATLSVSINTAGLTTPGILNGSIIIDDSGASSNSPLSVPVTLTVLAAPPLTATPSSLSFVYTPGGSAPANKTVALAAGAATINFNVTKATTSGGDWLSVTPTSGTTPKSLTVSVANYASLAPGTYNGSITVTPTVSNTVVIPVTLTVSTLVVTPTSLSFSYTTGGAVPAGQSIAVSTTGVNAAFTATTATTTGGGWLHLSSTSGTTPASLVVSVVPNSLGEGTYKGTVTVSSAGYTSQSVAVTLAVTKPKATIQISGNAVFVLPNTAAPATSTLTVGASDGSAQAFSVAVSSANSSWLTLSPTSGTTPASVKVTANPSGLVPGIYVAYLTVTEAALPIPTKTVSARLTVSGSNLVASPSLLTFTYQPGTSLPPPQTVNVSLASGSGTVALTGVTTDVSWLKVTSATSAPATLQVSINPGLLTVGTYEGDVIVNGVGSPNTSLQIPVTVTVNSLPQLTAAPTSLAFNYQIGGALPSPQSFALSTGDTPLNFTATSPGNWVQLSPARGATPSSVLVTVDPAGLGVGTYSGNVNVSAVGSAGPVSVAIALNVTGTGLLSVTPGQLYFAAQAGGSAPAAQSLTVNSASGPVGFTAASAGNWLSVSPASGTTPAALTVAANPAGLQSGTYSGSISITPAGSQVPQEVVVTLQVNGSGTLPTITGVINAASGAIGKVSPGMTVSIFGADLGPQTAVIFTAPDAGGTVAVTLGGTQVLIDGTAVPLLYTSSTQVNAIVPFELADKASTELQVVYNSNSSTGMTLPVIPAEPGLFTSDGSGKGQGAILNSDSSVNNQDNPAEAGLPIVLYGTGGGLTDPPSVDGTLNPLTSTGKLVLPATVTIGGQAAVVQYSGPAPGLVSGIIQVNAVIPAGTPSGDIPVVVTINDVASPPVTVAVK